MKTEVRTITPKIASEMLKRNVGNRRLSEMHVSDLANQMKKGNWMFDGQPIRTTVNGAILDGQHRLNAVVKSGLEQKFLIISGINTEAFKVMDTGRVRNAGDVLGIKGYENPGNIAAVVRKILTHNDGINGRARTDIKISNTDVLKFVEDTPGIVDICKSSTKYYRGFNKVLPVSDIGAYRYIFNQKSITCSKDFWSGVCFGLGLEDGSPLKVLRDMLTRDKMSKSSLSARHKKALIFKAWNAFRLDKKIKVLRWRINEGEKFPELV
jgi:hypothetical protein